MMARANNRGRSLDETPLAAGTTLTTTTAITACVVAFLGLSRTSVILVLAVVTVALVLGVIAHFRIPSAWAERNERHHAWVSSQPVTELSEFRESLADRQEALEEARHNWVRPLCATLALAVAAVIVSYEMIGALAPDPVVGPLTGIWMAVSLGFALLYAGSAVVAALGQKQEAESAVR